LKDEEERREERREGEGDERCKHWQQTETLSRLQWGI
jgi:hypothetical protein